MLSIVINAISTMRWLYLERETGGTKNGQKKMQTSISFYDEAEVLALQTQKRVLLKSKAKQKEVHRNGECSARNYDYSYNLCHCCNHKAEKRGRN